MEKVIAFLNLNTREVKSSWCFHSHVSSSLTVIRKLNYGDNNDFVVMIFAKSK